MIELDYAFLADYATVSGGKLTAVGASFTKMTVDSLNSTATIALAGRVRCDDVDVTTVPIVISATIPAEAPLKLGITHELPISEQDVPPYTGHRRGVVFAMRMDIPILAEGLVEFCIDVGATGDVDRILKFEVAKRDQDDM